MPTTPVDWSQVAMRLRISLAVVGTPEYDTYRHVLRKEVPLFLLDDLYRYKPEDLVNRFATVAQRGARNEAFHARLAQYNSYTELAMWRYNQAWTDKHLDLIDEAPSNTHDIAELAAPLATALQPAYKKIARPRRRWQAKAEYDAVRMARFTLNALYPEAYATRLAERARFYHYSSNELGKILGRLHNLLRTAD